MGSHHLSPVQTHVMEMLRILIDIFEKENIHYYMLGGTMLGAVRHKGFIPWDDDVDIGVERKDYERFIKKCRKKLPDHIKIRTYRDRSYHHYYYARVVDTRYQIKRMGSIKERREELWIDIFPLDGMPSGALDTYIHKTKLLLMRFLYHISCFDKVNVKRPGRPLLDRMIIGFLVYTHLGNFFASWDSNKYLDRIDRLLKKYPVETSEHLINFMGSTHAFREIFSKKVFGISTKYKFEDLELIGPKKYDYYLKRLYGDYMKLPPKSQRNVHAEEFVEEVCQGDEAKV